MDRPLSVWLPIQWYKDSIKIIGILIFYYDKIYYLCINKNDKIMALFRIFECDDYGRPSVYMGVFNADNKLEARQIAADFYKNQEIVNTGFYNSEEVTESQLAKELKRLNDEIKNKTQILNDK